MIIYRITYGEPQNDPEYLGMCVEWYGNKIKAYRRKKDLLRQQKTNPWLTVGEVVKMDIPKKKEALIDWLNKICNSDSI